MNNWLDIYVGYSTCYAYAEKDSDFADTYLRVLKSRSITDKRKIRRGYRSQAKMLVRFVGVNILLIDI
jgi:hypothetical protein